MFNYTVQEPRRSAAPTGNHWYRANCGEQLYDAQYFVCHGGKLLESLETEEGAITNALKAVEWYAGHNVTVARSVYRFTGFALIHIATINGVHQPCQSK